jgi:signal peptidase I
MSEQLPQGGDAVRDPSLEIDLSRPERKTPSLTQQIYQCLVVAALALASYFIISHFVLQSVTVVGVSMSPTLKDSQHYLLNRWMYLVRAPQHSDIVVIRDPTDNTFAVKRIIGTSGDLVYLRGGNVYLNGRPLHEPYLPPGTPTFPYLKLNEQLIKIGKNEYFVLGDNRKNSMDSRTYGVLSRDRILGIIIR